MSSPETTWGVGEYPLMARHLRPAAVAAVDAAVSEALTEQERTRGRALGIALRRARGQMTVRDLAQRCGLAQETIRKIERGAVPTPALFRVAALADALDVPLDDLVQEAVALTASISRVDVA